MRRSVSASAPARASLEGAVRPALVRRGAGRFVFVVTHQAGIAKGRYSEADMHALHAHIQQQPRAAGAHIDAFGHCPMHPDGVVTAYRGASDWRKPEPGMIIAPWGSSKVAQPHLPEREQRLGASGLAMQVVRP